MGYALLFVEVLAFSLLLVATLLAWVAPIERRALRNSARLAVLLGPLAAYATLTGLAAYFQFVVPITDRWFLPLVLVAVSYLAGGVWLFGRSTAAASWPRGKLAAACGVAAVLAVMTFWNLDLAVRQQLALLRTKVSALAMSAAPIAVPDRDNAALLYERAFEQIRRSEQEASVPDAGDKVWSDFSNADFDPNDPELQRYLDAHAGAVATLLEATSRPDCSFGHNYHWIHAEMLLPELVQIRHAVKLLAVEARTLAARGDAPGALRAVQAMLIMADHTSAEPILVNLLVGIAMDDLAIKALSNVLLATPASEQDLALLQLDETFSYGRRFQRTLRMEEAFGIGVLCDAAGSGEGDLMQQLGFAAWSPLAPMYRVFLLGQDVAAYREGLEKLQRLAPEPYYQSKPQWDDAGLDSWLRGPRGLLTRFLIPSLVGCAKQVAQGDARRRLSRILVDVHRYRAREGRLPQSLEDLVPEIARSVPIDPFDGQPLRLARKGPDLVAYSVGPDGQDDGGAPFDSDSRTGDIAVRVAHLEEGQ